MGQVSVNDLKAGNKVLVDGQPYSCVSNTYVKPGKGQAFNRIKLKNLISSRVIEKTYKSGEKIEEADIHETQMRMLYREGDAVVFMDDTTYDQIHIPLENIGETANWLLEEIAYEIIFFQGEAINIEPPTFVDVVITETAPGERGNTASGRVLKPAIIETGAQVQIPIFIDEGERVKIDTRTGEYVSRSST